MKLKCPACGAENSLDAWHQPDVKAFMELLIQIPTPVLKLIPPYLALFRPQKTGLTWRKAYKILSDLNELIKTGIIQVQGKASIPCRAAHWAEGMQKMLAQEYCIERPLPNHNYLRKVVYPLAEAGAAREEKQRTRPQMRRPAHGWTEEGGNVPGPAREDGGNVPGQPTAGGNKGTAFETGGDDIPLSPQEARAELKKLMANIGGDSKRKEPERMSKTLDPKCFVLLRILARGINERNAVADEFVDQLGEKTLHPNDFSFACRDLAKKGLVAYDGDLHEIHITENGKRILKHLDGGGR